MNCCLLLVFPPTHVQVLLILQLNRSLQTGPELKPKYQNQLAFCIITGLHEYRHNVEVSSLNTQIHLFFSSPLALLAAWQAY